MSITKIIFSFRLFSVEQNINAILAVYLGGVFTWEQHSKVATERILGHVTSNIKGGEGAILRRDSYNMSHPSFGSLIKGSLVHIESSVSTFLVITAWFDIIEFFQIVMFVSFFPVVEM